MILRFISTMACLVAAQAFGETPRPVTPVAAAEGTLAPVAGLVVPQRQPQVVSSNPFKPAPQATTVVAAQVEAPPPLPPVISPLDEKRQGFREQGQLIGRIGGKTIYRHEGRYLIEGSRESELSSARTAASEACVVRIVRAPADAEATRTGTPARAVREPTSAPAIQGHSAMNRARTIPVAAGSALLALALTSCAPLSERPTAKGLPVSASDARGMAESEWTEPALVRDGVALTVLSSPTRPPERILKQPLHIELEVGATIQDVVAALSNLGYSAIITDRNAAAADVRAPRYQGTVGGLLASLERASDVWFTWENGAFVVSSRERIVLSLPQERKLADRVASGLQTLGICVGSGQEEVGVAERALSATEPLKSASGLSAGTEPTAPQPTRVRGLSETRLSGSSSACQSAISAASAESSERSTGSAASWEAGMLTLLATPSEYRRALMFIERITQNAAVVNLQVAMVSVTMSEDANRGIDWSKLQLAVSGNHARLLDSLEPETDPESGEPTSNPTSSPGSEWINTGKGLSLTGGALRGVVSNSAFSMISFVDFLDTYGQAKTLQSVMLRTVTGSEVELKSVTQIPYVTGVGVGATSGAVAGSTSLLGSANTATANDGIILRMSPAFDAASQSVTIDMALSIHAVLGFQELSAGNQLGTLTQPTTAERTFNDVLRLRPGQTVVVGGITYDRVERDSNVPLYLPQRAAHQALKVKRESMFIVIRPTVTLLGALEHDAGRHSAASLSVNPQPNALDLNPKGP